MYSEGMALIIPPGYGHVIHSLRWANDPEPMAITYGIKLGAGATPENANFFAGQLGSAFTTMQSSMHNVLTHTGVEVTLQIGPESNPPIVGVSAVTFTGGGNEAGVLPQNSSYLWHKRSSLGGRGGRGRMFFPAVPEGQSDNLGNLSASTIANMGAQLETWRQGIVDIVEIDGMAILHDSLGANAGLLPPLVTLLQVDPRIATQRRRLRR